MARRRGALNCHRRDQIDSDQSDRMGIMRLLKPTRIISKIAYLKG